MNQFEKNIIGIYGEKGKAWLASLPQLVEKIATLWNLDRLEPLSNLSYNYVITGYRKEKPVVLKLSPDKLSLRKEAKALEIFAGYGAVSVLEHEDGMLLLERAIPGIPLKKHFPKDTAIRIACDVANKLHQAPKLKEHSFPHITDWLTALDQEWNIPKDTLQKARILKRQLLKITSAAPVFLHGDLHQDNILSNGNDWLVIDPKGVIGYPINEMWALVEKPNHDLKYISNYFDFSFDNVVKWYYVHLTLAACWCVEDNQDPKLFLDLTHVAQSMMT